MSLTGDADGDPTRVGCRSRTSWPACSAPSASCPPCTSARRPVSVVPSRPASWPRSPSVPRLPRRGVAHGGPRARAHRQPAPVDRALRHLPLRRRLARDRRRLGVAVAPLRRGGRHRPGAAGRRHQPATGSPTSTPSRSRSTACSPTARPRTCSPTSAREGVPAGRIRTVPGGLRLGAGPSPRAGAPAPAPVAGGGGRAGRRAALRRCGLGVAGPAAAARRARGPRLGPALARPARRRGGRGVSTSSYAVVGGGILGAAVARQLQVSDPDADVTVSRRRTGSPRTRPGATAAWCTPGSTTSPARSRRRLCRRGVGLLRDFCAEHDIAYDECGKVLVALDDVEEGRLDAIEDQGPRQRRARHPPALRRASCARSSRTSAGSPACTRPSTAIVDFPGVTRAPRRARRGARRHRPALDRAHRHPPGRHRRACSRGRDADGTTSRSASTSVVLCAGLCRPTTPPRRRATTSEPQVVPFRGEYLLLRPERRSLVNGLVYPVPDPRYPFLGVHLTPRVDGEVMVGPNAVLALAREGYDWRTSRPATCARSWRTPASARFARQHWRTGVRRWPAR